MVCLRCGLETDSPHPDAGACLIALDLSRARVEAELRRRKERTTVRVKHVDVEKDEEKTPESQG